jgi:hypothetical protein
MPLLDHFHPPLFPGRPWESFHSRWCNSIADGLNRQLPPRYTAEVQIHLGSRVEADVAELDRPPEPNAASANGPAAGVTVETWAPPAPPLVLPALFPDEFAVQVRDQLDDARLVAAVELVSPRNKDRPDSRTSFAAKCVAYLRLGIGLVTLDVVTNRQFNLHNETLTMLGAGPGSLMETTQYLYAAAYRPTRRNETNEIDVWPRLLALGSPLPVLPLALKGDRTVPLDVEAAYADARQRSRL